MADVVTGEAVVVDVPCARFPSRMTAIFIDIVAQLSLLAILTLVVVAAGTNGGLNAASEAAIALTVSVLVIVGYPTIFETLSRGRSLGKLALGLRVVGDDGGPERFRQALVRALAAVVEIWMLAGCPALITSMISAKGKRLGDLFAGTFVIQERLPARQYPAPQMPPQLTAWAASLELSGLGDETAAMARSYLARFWELTPAARMEFGHRIAADVASRVSPPPPADTQPADYLSAVLAERRRREQARLAARQAAQAGHGSLKGQGSGRGQAAFSPARDPAASAAQSPAPASSPSGPASSPSGPASSASGPASSASGPASSASGPASCPSAPGPSVPAPGAPPAAPRPHPDHEAAGGGAATPPAGGFVPPA